MSVTAFSPEQISFSRSGTENVKYGSTPDNPSGLKSQTRLGGLAARCTKSGIALTFVFAAMSGQTRGESPDTSNPPRTAAQPVLADSKLVESLRALKPLQKVHYSWPLPPDLLERPDDPRLFEYVRISGAVTISGEWATRQHVTTAAQVCARVNAAGRSVRATMAINYMPWHRKFKKGQPPIDTGPAHIAEIKMFETRLGIIKGWLAELEREGRSRPRVSALLFDHERFRTRKDDPKWNRAIDTKCDLFYDVGRKLFPRARIEWYGRGVQRSAAREGWSPYAWNTFANKADTFSCSLYRVPEIGYMRETFRRTYELAMKHGMHEVTPWVALGSGYRRQVDQFQEWDFDWDYDLIYAWQLGAELNVAWYGDRPNRFAPWHGAKVVIFYPPPFDPRTPAWPKHFVAYVRGANGTRSLPRDANFSRR